MSREVYWHLPGFMAFRSLNMSIIDLMSKYPDYFEDGYKVGSVYGTFPGAIWNGGRTVLGFTPKNDMEIILRGYNKKDEHIILIPYSLCKKFRCFSLPPR